MSDRSTRSSRSTLPLWTYLAWVLIGFAPSVASGQRVGGSIGASLTILQPVATQAVEVTALRLGRDGTAVFRTTAPTAGQASQIVMTSVSSSTNGFVPVRQVPVLLRGAGDPDSAARQMSYRVDVGRVVSAEAPRDVQLRIEYLAVAGT
jgi:hypothetical protein